jgi:hypothetical protein
MHQEEGRKEVSAEACNDMGEVVAVTRTGAGASHSYPSGLPLLRKGVWAGK